LECSEANFYVVSLLDDPRFVIKQFLHCHRRIPWWWWWPWCSSKRRYSTYT